jgi:hypothetical protein
MTLLALAVVLGALAASWVIAPIVARRMSVLGDPIAGGILDAEARKRVALASLKEIEYDRIGGKLDDADYYALRERLEREALLALRVAEGAQRAAEEFEITHSCGFVNPPGSRFCSGCGKRLG